MFDMQKNGEFQFGRIYVTPKSPVIYELKERSGDRVVFLARNPWNGMTWRQSGKIEHTQRTTGICEKADLPHSVQLYSDTWLLNRSKIQHLNPEFQQGIIDLIALVKYDG